MAHLDGETGALSNETETGWALFTGKAGCVACHSGPTFSDGDVHALGVPDHPALAEEADRQITPLRFYRRSGCRTT